MTRPDIRIYREILDAPEFTLSWLPEFTFAVDPESVTQIATLRGTSGVSMSFSDQSWDMWDFVANFLMADGRNKQLVAVESESQPKSHVRSHKGLFSKYPLIKKSEATTFEIALTSPYTHLVGFAKITADSARESMELFGDGMRSFILSTSEPLLPSLVEAQVVLSCIPRLPGPAYVNYARLVAMYRPRGARVLRMAGYSGEDDADLQVFTDAGDADEVAEILRSTLDSFRFRPTI
jgi:hypothetical protein